MTNGSRVEYKPRLPSDIIIARHGRITLTPATGPKQQLSGEYDFTIGLDEVGRVQADRLGRHLLKLFPDGFTGCMRSDFKRVAETATIALPGVPQVVKILLRERNRGDVARMPRSALEQLYPDEARQKQRSPIDWLPPNGESLREKATDLQRHLLPEMGRFAPDQPLPIFTSGEVVIAARTLPELGNMDDAALKRGLPNGWPALEVDNVQLDHYTRRDPETGMLGDAFNHMMSVCLAGPTATDSGWIRIER